VPGSIRRTNAEALGLGATTALADDATPGLTPIGDNATLVSRIIDVRSREELKIYAAPDSGASVIINVLGTPDRDGGVAPVVIPSGTDVFGGTIVAAAWAAVNVAGIPYVQLQIVEGAGTAGNVLAHLGRQ